ncbi:MAG: glyoxalase [Actinomycetota bacterium]|nr:glyoxalase [Actinomycetota bacterium]
MFVASVSVIAADPPASRRLFVDALGLPLHRYDGGGDYWSSEEVAGTRHFGVWPLTEAAQACFGSPEWPADRAVPQVSLEFEVESRGEVATTAAELEAQGHALVHQARTEPWGQTVARLLSIDGAVVGVSFAPWMHGQAGPPVA